MSVPPRRALNPDEILTQTDAPGYLVNGVFLPEGSDEASKLSAAQLGRKSIARRFTYADGRVHVWVRTEGQDPEQYGVKVAEDTDSKIREDWDKRVEDANKRAEAATPANQSASQQNEAALNNERSWNADPANIPHGATGFRDTHDEAAARKAATAKAALPTQTIKPVKQPDGSTKNVRVNVYPPSPEHPQGREEVLPSDVPGEPAPAPGAPTLKPDGKGGTVAVQVMPDGTIKTTPLPGVPSDAAAAYTDIKQDPKTGAWTGLTKDGQWVPISGGPGLAPEKPTIRPGQEGRPDIQYVPDPKNPGQVIAVPIQGTGTSTVALPEGFARPQFSPMQVSAVLGQTQQKLDTWVQGATDENDRRARMQKATELMAQAHQEATTYLNEQQIGTTAARDVYGNQISERGQTISRQNQLTSSGAGMANQAVGTLLPLLRYAQAGSGDAAKALVQLMGVMQQSVGNMGGLGAAPANVGVPGILGPYMQGGTPGQPAVAPAAPSAAALPATPPNAIGAGAVPGIVGPPAVPDAAAAAQMAQQQQAAAQAAAAAVPTAATPPAASPPVSVPAAAPTAAPGYGDPGFYRPAMQGSTPTDPGFYPPGMQGPDTTDPGFYPPGMQGAPQGLQGDGGMPPLAVMQALLQHVEPMMQADPNWGVNDLAEIQLGRSPWG